MTIDTAQETVWPLRVWILAILGALVGIGVQQLADLPATTGEWELRLAASLATALGIGGLAFGLAWRPRLLLPSVLVAVLCGGIAGGIYLWNGNPADGGDTIVWHMLCGLVAAACALILFQAAADNDARRPGDWSPAGLRLWSRQHIVYVDVHGHFWTDALLLAASALFAGLTIGIAHLLAEMFWLVKLSFLRDLLREHAVVAGLLGGAYGAAVGLLRDRGAIITALQRVGMLVLRVLAPVLAVGLLVFLAVLPVTGLQPLWQTGGTTPLMLGGAMLALFLANAVVTDRPADESRSKILASSAAALGLFLLPMVAIAAISSGLRIQQYGLSPERLWALTFIICASITAIAYAAAILGRHGWFERLRRTNLNLIFLFGVVALVLAAPLLGFDRLSTAHQVARLAGGQVSPEQFDYKALWFDFGPAGKEAVRKLASDSSDARIRKFAARTQKLQSRWDDPVNPAVASPALEQRLTVLPRGSKIDDDLRVRLVKNDACGMGDEACLVYFREDQQFALIVTGLEPGCTRCGFVRLLGQDENGKWSTQSQYVGHADGKELLPDIRAGKVEARPVQRRQVYVGGKPIGESLPAISSATP